MKKWGYPKHWQVVMFVSCRNSTNSALDQSKLFLLLLPAPLPPLSCVNECGNLSHSPFRSKSCAIIRTLFIRGGLARVLDAQNDAAVYYSLVPQQLQEPPLTR